MSNDSPLSKWTVRNYGLQTVRALIDLSTLPSRAYPKITRSMVKLPNADDTADSLGDLASIETPGKVGFKREEAARDIISGIAEQEFYRLHDLFKAGEAIFSEPNSAVPASSPRANLAACMRFEQLCWQKFGMSQFDRRAPERIEEAGLAPLTLPPEVMRKMSDVRFWIAAGVPMTSLPSKGPGRYATRLMPEAIYSLVLGLCGPTARITAMLRIWLACATGWNRKQITFLRRSPVVLRTESAVGLSDLTYFEEFKGRAGHNILAAIEDGRVMRGGIAEKALHAWQKTSSTMSSKGAWRLEAPGSSIIKALDDYEEIGTAVRIFDTCGVCADYFFISLTRNDGVSTHPKMEISHFGDLFPKGTNFQAIRKTFQLIEYNRVGSISAQVAASGHNNTRSLMKYYLTTPDFKDDLDAKIRFFQNSMGANIAVHGGFEEKIDVPIEITKWFYHFSRLGGFHVVARAYDAASKRYSLLIKFAADEFILGEIYLAHLALRREFHLHERGRWLIQGQGQLAAVKFYGRKMIAHMGMPQYFRAAREASEGLRSGKLSLPSMLD
ncbi:MULTISPECIES: hypothetical protein [unclassified Rhizobium]|uniref:hypothetical protein n=1 Tax=unclassified Rhizobium TaxID=2613769 RepID=UPI001AE6A7C0|nr:MULTISPECIES: hypothetical protein [unclassified Rhizobium]MBP2460515.1 hypothetical protein [Rhizobium sp. PvP014]MBP2527912.1 hypothetical protein [Rhizobium sp. PvP099]